MPIGDHGRPAGKVETLMFANLSTRLEGIVTKIRGPGRLTEADVAEVR